MPSPFPGMNPYLEQTGLWRGFHTSLPAAILQSALTPQLVPRYVREMEESLYLDRVDDRRGLFAVADAAVATPTPAGRGSRRAGPSRLGAPCGHVPVSRGVRRQRRWLTIRDTVGGGWSPWSSSSARRTRGPGRTASATCSSGAASCPAPPTWSNSTCSAAASGCRSRTRRTATTTSWSAADRSGRRSASGRSGSGTACRRSRSPSNRTSRHRGSTSRPSSTGSTTRRGTRYRIYDGEPEPPLSADDAEWARGILAAAPQPNSAR